MNIIEEIQQQSFLWDLEKGDGAAFFVSQILEKYDDFVIAVQQLDGAIREEKDLYFYFFAESLANAVEDIPNLKLSAEEMNKLCQLSKAHKPNRAAFVQYVKEHIDELFGQIRLRSGGSRRLAYRCLKEMFCYHAKALTDEAIEVILKNCSSMILADFEPFKKFFKRRPEFFASLFNDIDSVPLITSGIYVQFLTQHQPSSEQEDLIKGIAERLCTRFLPIFREKANDSDDKNIYDSHALFEDFYSLARKFRFPCANEYRDLSEQYEQTFGDYVQKYGQVFTQRFDLRPAIETLKKTDDPYRFMKITLFRDTRQNKIVNFYDRLFGIRKSVNPLADAFNRIETPSSEEFPYFIQDTLDVNQTVQATVMGYIFTDEKLARDFANYLPTIAKDIDKRLFSGAGELAIEVAGSIEIMSNLVTLHSQGHAETPLYQALVNGLCENIINTIEKTLRLLVRFETYSSKFYEEKHLTLGAMLQDEMPRSLSRSLIRLLQFYLDDDKKVTIVQGRPGRKLRNIHMHNIGHKYTKTTDADCLWLMHILMVVLNEIEAKLAFGEIGEKESPDNH